MYWIYFGVYWSQTWSECICINSLVLAAVSGLRAEVCLVYLLLRESQLSCSLAACSGKSFLLTPNRNKWLIIGSEQHP